MIMIHGRVGTPVSPTRSSLSINAPLMTVMLVACRVSSQGNSFHNVFFANRLNHLLRSHEFKFIVPL